VGGTPLPHQLPVVLGGEAVPSTDRAEG
jgi:hypothetical protein